MKTTFSQQSVYEYEFANGKKPRGVGSWMFNLYRNGAYTTVTKFGTLTQAKKEAMKEARSLDCSLVSLLGK